MRFGENDRKIVELLISGHKYSMEQLAELVNKRKHNVKNSLGKMSIHNLVTVEEPEGKQYFMLSDYAKSIVRERACPKCGTVRLLLDKDQYYAFCLNPDCRNRHGKKTLFTVARSYDPDFLDENKAEVKPEVVEVGQ